MAWLSTKHAPAPAERLVEGRALFIGTATMLIERGPFTVLTDPNFLHKGDLVHLGAGVTSQRRTNPARELSEIPSVDAVLLSHLHEDHFDREVSRHLDPRVLILTTPQAAGALRERGFERAYSLRTWQRFTLDKDGERLAITALPARHGPPLVARAMPQTMGSMLEFGDGDPYRMYISGDTLVFSGIREIAQRCPNIDLAVLHLGGARAFGCTVTMDAEQGVEMLRTVQPRAALPVHYDDYTVFKSPLEDFLLAARAAGFEDRVYRIDRGETFVFA